MCTYYITREKVDRRFVSTLTSDLTYQVSLNSESLPSTISIPNIVKSAGRVTMDNAADLKIVELEDQIKKQIKRNQKRKNEISQLRDKTDEKLKSWESYL